MHFLSVFTFYIFISIYLQICKKPSFYFQKSNFADQNGGIFYHQYLDISYFVFICRASRIMSYGLTVWIILDMPFIDWWSFVEKACDIFYHQYLDIFKFIFIYKTSGIMPTYKFFTFLYNCFIDMKKFFNLLQIIF